MNLADLKKPFAPDKVSWRVGSTTADKSKGMALCYIDARDVQDRLDEVCGQDGWQCRYVPMHDKKTVCEIGIRVERPDGVEWIWKSDGAGDSDVEAEKGSLSDAFKRAAVRFGVGRYLYDMGTPWVALEAAGRSYKIAAGEYSRLEALLAKDARASSASIQPKPATVATQTAPQPEGGPAPSHKATITPLAWLDECLDRVPKMDRPSLDAFSDKQADRLARVRLLHPEKHAEVIKAIGDRYVILG